MLLTSIHWILSAGCYAELQPSSQHPPVLWTHTQTPDSPPIRVRLSSPCDFHLKINC